MSTFRPLGLRVTPQRGETGAGRPGQRAFLPGQRAVVPPGPRPLRPEERVVDPPRHLQPDPTLKGMFPPWLRGDRPQQSVGLPRESPESRREGVGPPGLGVAVSPAEGGDRPGENRGDGAGSLSTDATFHSTFECFADDEDDGDEIVTHGQPVPRSQPASGLQPAPMQGQSAARQPAPACMPVSTD